MNRETLIGRLLWLREMRLRSEVARLQNHAATLADFERTRERACAAAAIETGVGLRDRASLGDVRMKSSRAALAASAEVARARSQVDHARRQTEAMREAQVDLTRAKRVARERVQESDADFFESWKRGTRPNR